MLFMEKKKFEWNCPKCSKIIMVNSENTLIIGKGSHLLKHEIKRF